MQKILIGLLLLFCIASAGFIDDKKEKDRDRKYYDHDKFDKHGKFDHDKFDEFDKFEKHGKRDKDDKDDKDCDEEEEEKVCYKTGKYGHICTDHIVYEDCYKKPEYECYEHALCELQFQGRCGFTITPELIICLIKKFDP
jgi:hypothetical protein